MAEGGEYEEVEARGKEALKQMRESVSQKGYDSTLQGLERIEPEIIEVPQEFKSKVTLGFAGFLIVAGVIFLFAGGSLWEPKGFNPDGTPPREDTPAFGFVPKAPPAPATAD